MGSSVASSVGRMVKLAVGIEDGKIVTKCEGYTEGDALGLSLGDDDGITVGSEEGRTDGVDEGYTKGDAL